MMHGVEIVRFGNRSVPGFGVGDDTVSSGIAALQSAVAQYSGPVVNPGGAVSSLKSVGTAVVSSIGETLSGSSPDVVKLAQAAQQQNDKLAAVNSSGTATQADVDLAKGIVNQMVSYYQQATKAATSGAGTAPPAGAPPAGAPSPPFDFFGWLAANKTAVAIGGTAVVVGGIALIASSRRRAA